MANLPEEVLVEILSWLPVESLVRFKCVSKSWYALFNNPNFVSQHLINHQSEDSAIVRRHCQGKGTVFSFISSVADGGGGNDFCIKDFDLDLYSEFPYNAHGRILVMCGHRNGIVAIYDLSEDIILCNPAIREFRLLPDSCFHSFPRKVAGCVYPEPSKPLNASTHAIGFGYDPRTDDYKVVRIVDFCESGIMLSSKAEVISLRADSTWREISGADIGADLWSGDSHDQFFNGVYYWQAQEYSTNEWVLVSFDMADEVFSKAPLPDFCQDRILARIKAHLGVLNNGSIALFVHPYRKSETCIDVWVMKEFGSKESWIKQLTIGPLIGLKRLLVFWKNDEEILAEDVNGQLISYNLATFEPKTVHFGGGPSKGWEGATYRKSLVPVKVRKDFAA